MLESYLSLPTHSIHPPGTWPHLQRDYWAEMEISEACWSLISLYPHTVFIHQGPGLTCRETTSSCQAPLEKFSDRRRSQGVQCGRLC